MFLTQFETILGLPDYIGYIFFFIVGAVIGSFLNVVIHRLPAEEWITSNSACPKCKAKIKSYDNIPILSWLILGGKCRNCKNRISIRYPAVELLTALLFVLFFWWFDLTPILPVYLIFAAAIVALIFIDALHMKLLDAITYPGMIFSFAVRIIFPIFFSHAYIVTYFTDLKFAPLSNITGWPVWAVSLAGAALGALVGGGSLWLVGILWKALRGVDAMGLGDVKMMAAVGALLGWRLALATIFLGAFAGAVTGIAIMISRREFDLKMRLPYGIFLGIGAILSALWGETIIAWYITNFIPN